LEAIFCGIFGAPVRIPDLVPLSGVEEWRQKTQKGIRIRESIVTGMKLFMMALAFLWAIIFIGMANSVAATVPVIAHIGGLFAPLTPSGHRDLAQAEHLAAFLMAINDINNKTDGIYDDVLAGIHLRTHIQGASPLVGATKQFLELGESTEDEPLFSVISALNNEDMLIIAQLAEKTGTQMITTVSDSGEYYDPTGAPPFPTWPHYNRTKARRFRI
jgi:hypothetical protein